MSDPEWPWIFRYRSWSWFWKITLVYQLSLHLYVTHHAYATDGLWAGLVTGALEYEFDPDTGIGRRFPHRQPKE